MRPGLPTALVRRARARQRRLAIVACALWLLGHQVLPDLHLALHDQLGEHQHEGDRPRRVLRVTAAGGARVEAVAHRHGGVVHRHAPRAPAVDHRGEVASASTVPRLAAPPARTAALPDPDHGATSLAHRTIAIAAPPPAITAPPPVAWMLWSERADVLPDVAGRAVVEAAARGPPASAVG